MTKAYGKGEEKKKKENKKLEKLERKSHDIILFKTKEICFVGGRRGQSWAAGDEEWKAKKNGKGINAKRTSGGKGEEKEREKRRGIEMPLRRLL